MEPRKLEAIVPETDVPPHRMIAAYEAACAALRESDHTTLDGIVKDIKGAIMTPEFADVKGGCDSLMTKIVHNATSDVQSEDVSLLIDGTIGEYIVSLRQASEVIANYTLPFVRDTSIVVVHGCGSLVTATVASSIVNRTGVRFFVVQGLPQRSGEVLIAGVRAHPLILEAGRLHGREFAHTLEKSLVMIPDSCVATVLQDDSISFVLLGANVVTEQGGLVHTNGSLQIAMIAQAMSTPFYVVCESFKFTRIFPLTTKDLYKGDKKRLGSALSSSMLFADESPPSTPSTTVSPSLASPGAYPPDVRGNGAWLGPVEFVPPSYITLILTETGIMPPGSVADEMLTNRITYS
jgi:translation initiation factor 2B subunit (eIF-2B alpha/beta/delta family)